MEEDSLRCYWDFSYAYIHIFNKKNSKSLFIPSHHANNTLITLFCS